MVHVGWKENKCKLDSRGADPLLFCGIFRALPPLMTSAIIYCISERGQIQMKLLQKIILNDGEIMQMPLDTVIKEEDPRRLGRGADRIEILGRVKQNVLGFGIV